MQQRIPQVEATGEGGVIELKEYRFRVRSFSDPERHYLVDLSASYCACPHHAQTGAYCRHLTLAEAVCAIRERGSVATPAERIVREQVRDIFAPVTADYRRSYEVLLDALSYRYCSARMREAARDRHARTLRRAGFSERRAA